MSDQDRDSRTEPVEVPASLRPRVILVRPQGGENVGSVCRAIKNMGAGRLSIVAPDFDFSRAKRMAVHARDVLEDRIQAPTLAAAVAGCSLVVGTTARIGAYRDRTGDISEVADRVVALTREALTRDSPRDGDLPVAFVFGPEDTGLTNADIAHCHLLAAIPSSEEYRSINLAQAVMITLYEFRRRWQASQDSVADRAAGVVPADAGQTEEMFEQLEAALLRIGFLSEDNPGHIMAGLRGLLGRAGMDPREVSILRGMARQIEWYGTDGHKVLAEKRTRGDKVR